MYRASDISVRVGVVAIGRNEGERLSKCLKSVLRVVAQAVYVDSGSNDGSVQMAAAMGASVLPLSMQVPFTAARARNEGFRCLFQRAPSLRYVQFIDGDCEIVDGWLEKAAEFLDEHPDVALVCGRRRERYPNVSIYNLLCDIEWDTPLGESKSCGGDALIRIEAFEAVNGYRAELIAGEEPELCIRLRLAGWRIWRVDHAMTVHDAAMARFGQWWRRTLRSGHAFAEGAFLYRSSPERHYVQESRSAWFWGLALPLGACVLATLIGPWGFAAFAAYPVQVVRLAVIGKRRARENWLRAAFLVIGKFPEMLGQLRFLAYRLFGRRQQLIEYK